MELEISIPSDLNEITLSQYQKFIEVTKNEDNDNSFIQHKLVQIFCNVELEYVAKMKQKDINEIVESINSMFKNIPSLQMRFTLSDIEFGFIPILDDMSAGEYMDLDGYMNDWGTMHKAMAVLFRPITNKFKKMYSIEEYNGSEKYCELMKSMPVGVALSAHVFFFTLGNELLRSMNHYLLQAEEMIIQKNHNLGDNGVGINQFMHLHREMSEDLMKLPSYQLISV